MGKKTKSNRIDLFSLLISILERFWLVVLCAEIGFGASYYYTTRILPETFTASGTMYVNNANPNMSDYQNASSGDLSYAAQLIKTYLVVVKSDKVMENIVNRLSEDHPGVDADYVSSTLSMASVSETGVVSVTSRAYDPKLARDIVNVVMEEAPEEIVRVVGTGNIEIIDYAIVPIIPDGDNVIKKSLVGCMAGAALALCIILALFMFNQKVTNTNGLEDRYTPPILASIQRINMDNPSANSFLLRNDSDMDIVENYAKLRMNLFYTLVGKDSKSVIVTSSVSGEGKSTIASNLSISCSMSGKKVLLIDSDMRRASLNDIFGLNKHLKGLSDYLAGGCRWQDIVIEKKLDNLDILPAGHFPPNPAELLGSQEMIRFLKELEQTYDLIILDMPPINIVADPLVLSANVAGCLFVTRQYFSDHRDIRKALLSAEMTGMNVMGFVFYGERINKGSYYSRRYYKNYYRKYDTRNKIEPTEHLEKDISEANNNDS